MKILFQEMRGSSWTDDPNFGVQMTICACAFLASFFTALAICLGPICMADLQMDQMTQIGCTLKFFDSLNQNSRNPGTKL